MTSVNAELFHREYDRKYRDEEEAMSREEELEAQCDKLSSTIHELVKERDALRTALQDIVDRYPQRTMMLPFIVVAKQLLSTGGESE